LGHTIRGLAVADLLRTPTVAVVDKNPPGATMNLTRTPTAPPYNSLKIDSRMFGSVAAETAPLLDRVKLRGLDAFDFGTGDELYLVVDGAVVQQVPELHAVEGPGVVIAKVCHTLADILDDTGKSVVAKPIRLVVADDTKVGTAFAAKKLKKGAKVRAIGIPRLNLDKLMDEAVKNPGTTVIS
jgi:hypothetical protein